MDTQDIQENIRIARHYFWAGVATGLFSAVSGATAVAGLESPLTQIFMAAGDHTTRHAVSFTAASGVLSSALIKIGLGDIPGGIRGIIPRFRRNS